MTIGEQAWVTSAHNDEAAVQAMVLARSLRRVVTSRKLLIIVSKCVHADMRIQLGRVFNAVIEIDNDTLNSTGISVDVYLKIYCWNLTIFKKCVYVHPTNMLLRNSDDLFEFPEFSITAEDSTASVFVYEPSVTTFHKILDFYLHNKQSGTNLTKFFNLTEKNKNISSDFNYSILEEESSIPPTVKIVRFAGKCLPWDFIKKNRNTENGCMNLFIKQWLTIYYQDVEILLAPRTESINTIHENDTDSQSLKNDEEALQNAIAIIGVSCRFPGANNIEEFWNLLENGNEGIRVIPEDRWKNIEHYGCDPNVRKVESGFLNCPIDEFDGKFFNMSPRELDNIDPQQRLLLEITWEALENAAINPSTLKGTNAGVYTGIWTRDYHTLMTKRPTAMAEFHRTYMGTSFAATSGRVSYHLGLTGPNIAIESGCSSSMVSLHLACENLRKGDSNLAIASGVNLILHPFTRESVSATHILAADGRCKTFDAKADGFGRAEGCAAIILKRYSDAVKDGDRILALIRGTGISQEGTSSSFGTPSKYCQLISIQNALSDARVAPKDVSYVEAHGTGTIVGDPIEVSAISAAYGGDRDEALYIGSVKTNIGHTESCAGMAGLIKVVLALNNDIIPPHRNLETLNPKIDLGVVPALINLDPVPWEKKDGKERLAGVSSFGISGANVHLIVQETPSAVAHSLMFSKFERPLHILTLSAKSEKALNELLERYKQHFMLSPSLALADSCYTANTGRAQFKHRATVIGKNNADISMKLSENILKGKAIEVKPKIAFLFTGQGSQYVGMGKILYNTHPLFKDNMDRCAALLKKEGIDILEAMWGDKRNELDQSVYSQTGIFCVEYCLLKLWESFGIAPDCVLGHSLGEFVAAVAANILVLEDAIKLVATRSKLVNKLPAGGMLAVRTDLETVQKLIQEFGANQKNIPEMWVDIAVVNSDEEIVVAGRAMSIEAFEAFCFAKKIKVQHIACKQAFHSRDMDMILKEYGKVASSISNGNAKCTYISGTTGKVAVEKLDSLYWQQHARESVNFQTGMQTAMQEGCSIFIEIGAHPILLALGMNNTSQEQSQSCLWLPAMRRNEDEWTTMLTSMAKLYINGIEINWANFDSYYNRKKVTLPSYPFQREKYWYESKIVDFSDMELNGKAIHPLLGRNIQTASADIIYHSCVNLQNVPYIEDHKVGSKIVMPGAGFLEMILAGGHAATTAATESLTDPVTSIMVSDFKIIAPLELTPGENTELQVVVSMQNDEVENEAAFFQISVHRKKKDESGNISWVQHATGKFFPHVANQSNDTINISQVKKQSVEISTKDVYQMLNHIGLNFGDTFKSISSFWKNGSEILAEIPVGDGLQVGSYLCHPVISDALIQSKALSSDPDRKNLQLPVGVDKFVLVGKIPDKKVFAHVKLNDKTSVRLYDSNGKLLAIMEGIQIVATTLSSFLNTLNLQKRVLPGLFQESWRNTGGPMNNRVDLSKVPGLNNILHVLNDDLKEMERLEEIELPFIMEMDKLCHLYILSAFNQIGWVANIGHVFTSWEFISRYMISPRHQGLVEHMFTILCEENFLQELNYLEKEEKVRRWKVIKDITFIQEDLENTKKKLNLTIQDGTAIGDHVVLPVTIACGEKLPQFLQGKESPLAILFPEVENETNAEKFYTHTGLCHRSNEIITKSIEICFRNANGTLRICEIGAGTGSTTVLILNFLKKNNIKFHYTFTDISTVFLSKAKARFSAEFKNIEYKLLNIENDPKSQGFYPHHYDVIIAANVLHATKSLKECTSNIRHLLVPSGLFILFETLEPQRLLDITFGLIEGYWRFNDYDLRPHHALINAEKWQNLILANGFEDATLLKSSGERGGVILSRSSHISIPFQTPNMNDPNIWVLFVNNCSLSKSLVHNMETIGKTIITVEKSKTFYEISKNRQYEINPSEQSDVSNLLKSIEKSGVVDGIIYLWNIEEENMDQKSITQPLLYISQHILSADTKILPKLLVVTRGVAHIGDQGIINNISEGTLWGFTRTIKSEQPLLHCSIIDTDPDEINEELAVKEIISEIWNTDLDWQVAYRDRKRYVLRINPLEPSKPFAPPNTERFQLILPKNNKIADLNIGPSSKSVLGDEDVEVSVQGTALNFRDLFIILKPDMFKSLYDAAVGTDFSGIITEVGPAVKNFKIGDKVFGLCSTGAFSSHAVVSSHLIAHKPKNWTLLEAACLPSVFLTAYYCLVDIAKLKPSDTILIHVASGGVGLVAIQIAQEIGATIIATAGSKRKRQYLKNVGIKYVFHSRNTTYGEDIEKATGGKGVDVVLNSLTGPNFKETSLKICARNARFVEMSKINIWQPEEVTRLRPDVKYWIVDLEKAHPETMKHLVSKMEEGLHKGVIKPLPYVRFELSQTREAFNFFQKAHHIGKIVVAMPKVSISKGRLTSTESLFNDESSYIITGGLGGIGIEVAKWMVELGAKYVALVGRNLPDENALKTINNLNASFGANVITLQFDVGDFSQCEKMFQILKNNYPPVRGIMHAAGKISDGILSNQTWEKFELAYNAKVKGGWNLHVLTRNLNLEHFILFSSIAATLGPISQSNHSSANSFLDTLAHYRNAIGLPAQSINWGAWSEVGAAVNLAVGTEGAFGIKPFSPSQGIAGLNAIMKSHEIQLSVLEVDFTALKKMLPHMGKIVGDMVKENVSSSETTMGSDSFWKGIHGLNLEQRIPYIKTQVESIIRLVLKLPDCESIDEQQNFSELGLDSLMAVELRNNLQSLCGKQLTLNTSSLVDNPTTKSLSLYLAELTCSVDEFKDAVTVKEMQTAVNTNDNQVLKTSKEIDGERELRLLVKEDSQLPIHIKGCGIAIKPSDVRNLFVTGVTGQLGPYLLHEMSKNKKLTVFCLVRAKNNEIAENKIKAALAKNQLTLVHNNIVGLAGSIVEEHFGLPENVYKKLAEKIDAVWHMAVKSNHIEQYQKFKSTIKTDIRTVNVLATKRILEFATEIKTKRVLYASSLVATNKSAADGSMSELLPELDNNGEGITMGYSVSKFVSEKLFAEAIRRGIPCQVLRYPVLTGDSQTGRFFVDSNHFMILIMTCMKLGVLPKSPQGFISLPVDSAAKLTVGIFFNDQNECGAYNINNPHGGNQAAFLKVAAELGHPMKLVDFTEFTNEVDKLGENSLLYSFKDIYKKEGGFEQFISSSAVFGMKGQDSTKWSPVSEKVKKCVPNAEEIIPLPEISIRKHLEYAKNSDINILFDL